MADVCRLDRLPCGRIQAGSQLKSAFFPIDLQFLSTVDIFLPNDSALSETKAAAAKAREIIEQQAHQMETEESDGAEGAPHLLKSLTTFVGGGGPRFWYSLAPENKQVNYAQVVIEIDDKRRMARFATRLQPALSAAIPGAFVDVQELQTNGSKNPIEIFVSGRAESSTSGEAKDMATLRQLANQVEKFCAPFRMRAGFATIGSGRRWSRDSKSIPIAPTWPGLPMKMSPHRPPPT